MKRHVATAMLAGALSIAGVNLASAQDMYLGELRAFGFNFCPIGWASANGAILSISSNAALFALLGTTYGGNGTSHFRPAQPSEPRALRLGPGPRTAELSARRLVRYPDRDADDPKPAAAHASVVCEHGARRHRHSDQQYAADLCQCSYQILFNDHRNHADGRERNRPYRQQHTREHPEPRLGAHVVHRDDGHLPVAAVG